MKKGKIIGKKQVVIGVLILALGAAVWLNMKYSAVNTSQTVDSGSKNFGDSIYVNADNSALPTGGTADYFAAMREERNSTREDAIEVLDTTINDVKSDEETKRAAVAAKANIAMRMENETAVESLVKAKGFSDVMCVIGDDGVSVVVKSGDLLGSETLQIQDIVVSQTGESLEKIKIVTVK